ncbi:MAG: YihY/virulence factor BrkB family protein [Chloroflexi bacterium]|nr:YihY/virulence factor BrkB family protein [Chloroflexota bacterium]
MLSPRRLWLLAKHSVLGFSDDNGPQMAAAISYYVLFSLFPLVIFTIGVFGLVFQDSDMERRLIDELTGLLPVDAGGAQDVENAVRELTGASSGVLGVLGLVGLAWAASAMFAVIRRSLDIAFDLSGRRPFLRQKIVDFGMMALVGVIFLASLGATTTIRVAREAIEDTQVLGALAEGLGIGWSVAAFIALSALSFVAFALLYWLVPATHVRLRHVWPGALLAAVVFEAVKLAFGIYLEHFSRYDLVFGSLGAVIAFLFLVFLGANTFLLGAEMSATYPRVQQGEFDRPDGLPRRTPREAAWRAIRGLVVHDDEKQEPEPPREGNAG